MAGRFDYNGTSYHSEADAIAAMLDDLPDGELDASTCAVLDEMGQQDSEQQEDDEEGDGTYSHHYDRDGASPLQMLRQMGDAIDLLQYAWEQKTSSRGRSFWVQPENPKDRRYQEKMPGTGRGNKKQPAAASAAPAAASTPPVPAGTPTPAAGAGGQGGAAGAAGKSAPEAETAAEAGEAPAPAGNKPSKLKREHQELHDEIRKLNSADITTEHAQRFGDAIGKMKIGELKAFASALGFRGSVTTDTGEKSAVSKATSVHLPALAKALSDHVAKGKASQGAPKAPAPAPAAAEAPVEAPAPAPAAEAPPETPAPAPAAEAPAEAPGAAPEAAAPAQPATAEPAAPAPESATPATPPEANPPAAPAEAPAPPATPQPPSESTAGVDHDHIHNGVKQLNDLHQAAEEAMTQKDYPTALAKIREANALATKLREHVEGEREKLAKPAQPEPPEKPAEAPPVSEAPEETAGVPSAEFRTPKKPAPEFAADQSATAEQAEDSANITTPEPSTAASDLDTAGSSIRKSLEKGDTNTFKMGVTDYSKRVNQIIGGMTDPDDKRTAYALASHLDNAMRKGDHADVADRVDHLNRVLKKAGVVPAAPQPAEPVSPAAESAQPPTKATEPLKSPETPAPITQIQGEPAKQPVSAQPSEVVSPLTPTTQPKTEKPSAKAVSQPTTASADNAVPVAPDTTKNTQTEEEKKLEAPLKKLKGLAAKHMNIFGKALKNSPHLNEQQKLYYAQSSHAVLSRMTPAMLTRLDAGLTHGAHFAGSTEGVKERLLHIARNHPELLKKMQEANDPGGAYVRSTDKSKAQLILDGDGIKESEKGDFVSKRKAQEIYAHEMVHAIDGLQREYSLSPEWNAIYNEKFKNVTYEDETKTGILGKYSRKDPTEAFAEFGRALLSGRFEHSAVKAAFPEAFDFWVKRGLIEDVEAIPGNVKQDDIFKDKIDLGDKGHADTLLPAGVEQPTGEKTDKDETLATADKGTPAITAPPAPVATPASPTDVTLAPQAAAAPAVPVSQVAQEVTGPHGPVGNEAETTGKGESTTPAPVPAPAAVEKAEDNASQIPDASGYKDMNAAQKRKFTGQMTRWKAAMQARLSKGETLSPEEMKVFQADHRKDLANLKKTANNPRAPKATRKQIAEEARKKEAQLDRQAAKTTATPTTTPAPETVPGAKQPHEMTLDEFKQGGGTEEAWKKAISDEVSSKRPVNPALIADYLKDNESKMRKPALATFKKKAAASAEAWKKQQGNTQPGTAATPAPAAETAGRAGPAPAGTVVAPGTGAGTPAANVEAGQAEENKQDFVTPRAGDIAAGTNAFSSLATMAGDLSVSPEQLDRHLNDLQLEKWSLGDLKKLAKEVPGVQKASSKKELVENLLRSILIIRSNELGMEGGTRGYESQESDKSSRTAAPVTPPARPKPGKGKAVSAVAKLEASIPAADASDEAKNDWRKEATRLLGTQQLPPAVMEHLLAGDEEAIAKDENYLNGKGKKLNHFTKKMVEKRLGEAKARLEKARNANETATPAPADATAVPSANAQPAGTAKRMKPADLQSLFDRSSDIGDGEGGRGTEFVDPAVASKLQPMINTVLEGGHLPLVGNGNENDLAGRAGLGTYSGPNFYPDDASFQAVQDVARKAFAQVSPEEAKAALDAGKLPDVDNKRMVFSHQRAKNSPAYAEFLRDKLGVREESSDPRRRQYDLIREDVDKGHELPPDAQKQFDQLGQELGLEGYAELREKIAQPQMPEKPAAAQQSNKTVATAMQPLLKRGHGTASLADLADATKLPLTELHDIVQDMRRQGILSGQAHEGRVGTPEEKKRELAAAIDDHGTPISRLAIRDEKAFQQLLGGKPQAPGAETEAPPAKTWSDQDTADANASLVAGKPVYTEPEPTEERINDVKKKIEQAMATIPSDDSMTSTAEFRDKVGVSRREFDTAMKRLYGEDKIHLIAISDLSLISPEQLKRSIQGLGETFTDFRRTQAPGAENAAEEGVKQEDHLREHQAGDGSGQATEAGSGNRAENGGQGKEGEEVGQSEERATGPSGPLEEGATKDFSGMTEQQLLPHLVSGDPDKPASKEAEAAFWTQARLDEISRRVHGYLGKEEYSRGGNDIAQQVFLNTRRALRTGKVDIDPGSKKSVAGYMATAVRNAVIDWRRNKGNQAHESLNPTGATKEGQRGGYREAVSGEPSPVERAETREEGEEFSTQPSSRGRRAERTKEEEEEHEKQERRDYKARQDAQDADEFEHYLNNPAVKLTPMQRERLPHVIATLRDPNGDFAKTAREMGLTPQAFHASVKGIREGVRKTIASVFEPLLASHGAALQDREKEVMQAAISATREGKTYDEAARQIGMTESDFRLYRRRAQDKLEAEANRPTADASKAPSTTMPRIEKTGQRSLRDAARGKPKPAASVQPPPAQHARRGRPDGMAGKQRSLYYSLVAAARRASDPYTRGSLLRQAKMLQGDD